MVPFYEDDMEIESEASSEDENISQPRWCTIRKHTHINSYGDAASYFDMEFTRNIGIINILKNCFSFISFNILFVCRFM